MEVAYFSNKDVEIRFSGTGGTQVIPDSKGFAYEYMSLARFKQI
jgi:hypothetical protein